MDEETRRRFDLLLDQVEKAMISAAKARIENHVLANLLGHLTGRWAATTQDWETVLAQIAELTRVSVQDATDSDPTNEIGQAAVKMATLLQKQMERAFDDHLASQAERRKGLN